MNIANFLTILRLLFVPIFGYLLFDKQYVLSIILFSLLGITDIIDGYFARKYNTVTRFGELIDPLADKFLQVTALIVLCYNGIIPIVIVAVILFKEFMMALGAIALYKQRQFLVPAIWFGKFSTIILFIAILVAMFLEIGIINFVYMDTLVNILFALGAFTSLYAWFMYFLNYLKVRRQIK